LLKVVEQQLWFDHKNNDLWGTESLEQKPW